MCLYNMYTYTELPYHRGTDFNYMKWKWHDTITLDFTCRRDAFKKLQTGTHHGVSLSFEAEGRQEVDFTEHIVLGVHEKYRLYGDLASAASGTHTHTHTHTCLLTCFSCC